MRWTTTSSTPSWRAKRAPSSLSSSAGKREANPHPIFLAGSMQVCHVSSYLNCTCSRDNYVGRLSRRESSQPSSLARSASSSPPTKVRPPPTPRVHRAVEQRHVVGLVGIARAGLLDQLDAEAGRGRREQRRRPSKRKRLAAPAPCARARRSTPSRRPRNSGSPTARCSVIAFITGPTGLCGATGIRCAMRQMRDALGLGEPAGMRDVRLQDVDAPSWSAPR